MCQQYCKNGSRWGHLYSLACECKRASSIWGFPQDVQACSSQRCTSLLACISYCSPEKAVAISQSHGLPHFLVPLSSKSSSFRNVSHLQFCVRHQQTGKSSHLWPRSQNQLAASPTPSFSRAGSSNLAGSLTFGVCSRDFLNTLHGEQEQARSPCIAEADRPASVCPVYGPITLTGGCHTDSPYPCFFFHFVLLCLSLI